MAFGAQLKRIDFYRRVPVELTEPTAPGAIISILASVLMVILFFGELVSYLRPPTRSEMFVGQDASGTARLKVNLNMTYYQLPCFAFSLDVLDVLGRHEVGVESGLRHLRVRRDGTVIGPFDHSSNFAEQTGEGCRAEGYVMVNKVPGNFHVSAHGKQNLVMQYLGGNINVAHSIHELWFGEVEFKGNHDYEGQVHPLNGMSNLDGGSMHYEYFLDIVPTTYKKGRGTETGYQFTANMHKQELPYGHMAAAFFKYQLSPITVQFGKEDSSFFHFLTYVCAIVGGVFTVAGMLSRSIHTTAVQFQRRVLGKDN